MPAQPALPRRSLFALGAVAGAAAALPQHLAAALPPSVDQAPGKMLGAWLRPGKAGGIDLEVADTRRLMPWRSLVEMPLPMSTTSFLTSWSDRQLACAQARAALKRAAALNWRVAPAECVMAAGVITHEPSGRTIPYRLWITA